jgi:hypothetical protein
MKKRKGDSQGTGNMKHDGALNIDKEEEGEVEVMGIGSLMKLQHK